jgi:hypothetical protein
MALLLEVYRCDWRVQASFSISMRSILRENDIDP